MKYLARNVWLMLLSELLNGALISSIPAIIYLAGA